MVLTYGREKLEIKNYVKHLSKSKEAHKKFTLHFSASLALLLMMIFAFYAYSLYFGALLRIKGVERIPGELYSGGSN